MKLGNFNTIPEPPMSNVRPESDAYIAQRLAKFNEKLDILRDGDGTFVQREVNTVRAKVKREMQELLDAHREDQEAYQRWIDAGRPELLDAK